MIHPKYGNRGDDHGASRSRRSTTPRFTALSATIANAIVMETEAWSVLGASGPHSSTASASPAMTNPLTSQRTTWGRVTILVPGVRGGRCITLGSGTSAMNPMTTVTTTKNLQNSNCIGNSATPPLMSKIVARTMSCSTDGQDRQLQLHVRGDASVDVAAEIDGAHERREVVVGEHDLARLLRDFGAAPHRDSDVGLLERGGVVDRVAGHGHDLAGFLHEPGETDLVLGCDPTEDVELREAFDHLLVGQALQVGAGDHSRAELELVGDRTCRHRVVAGDHAHVDPGVEGDPHGLLGLGAQRIDDPDQRDQQQLARPTAIGSASPARHRAVVEVADREREDPETLLRQLLVGGEELVAHVGDRDLLAVPERVAAPFDDDVRCTLDRHEVRCLRARRR